MYEIELKAHVYNYAAVQAKIDSFAVFFGKCEKTDVYWQQSMFHKGKESMQLRIREQKTKTPDGKISFEVLVTYKRKELHHAQNTDSEKATAYEVNDEQEFTISDRKPFETMLHDAGFEIALEKHKTAMQWKYDDVFLELCTVRKLGDFLELEIMRDNNSKHTTETAHLKLQTILKNCNIPLEQIEPKYYSMLLRETD